MVRVGFMLSLCDSVVALQDLFASPVWESDVCAQIERLEKRYAPTASSISRLKRAARDWRGQRADLPCSSHSEILAIGMPIILSPWTFGVQRMPGPTGGVGDTPWGQLVKAP